MAVAWQDTYLELGSEIQVAKTAAIQAFMAAPPDSDIGASAAIPPIQSRQQRVVAGHPLSSADVAKVRTVVWRALALAILEHVGPTSSDGSVTFGIVDDANGVPQLDIKAVGGGGGGGLATLYSVDFSTLGAADLLTGGDGVKTIDGHAAWNIANTANATAVALNDGTHAGLYLRCNATPSDYYGSTITAPRAIVGLTDLHGKKFHELVEQWVIVQFTQPHPPDVNYQGARIGIKLIPDDSESGMSYQLDRAHVGTLQDYIEQRVGGGTSSLSTSYNGFTPPPLTDDVIAFHIMSNNFLEICSGASVGGALPDIHDLKLSAVAQFVAFNAFVGGFQQNYPYIASGQSNALQWALLIACSSWSDTSGNSDLLIEKLQILGR